MAVLRAKDLTSSELLALVSAWGKRGRVWLEAPDGWSLAYWPGLAELIPWCAAGREPGSITAKDAVERSVAGRLFDRAGELRWRKLPVLGESAWRTVFLGEDCDAVTPLPLRTELNNLQPRHSEHPLWGILTAAARRRDDEPAEWVELRIPHRFRYPVQVPTPQPKTLAVKVVVETWKDQRGEAHFMRLCDLSAYDVGE
jgi:hypothetical protein